MRTYAEISGDLSATYKRTVALDAELQEFRAACPHNGERIQRVSMSAGIIGRWENCSLCGQFFNVPSQPGDNDEIEEDEI